MPVYTVDNPSKSLDKAKECLTPLLGQNLKSIESITPDSAFRISVETTNPIDTNEVSIALAKLAPKAAAAQPVAASEAKPESIVPGVVK